MDCWVLGKSKNGKQVVHLYHSGSRYRLGSAYEEKIATLPISLAGATLWVAAAPPERAEAESGKFLNMCPEFTVAFRPEFNDDGTPKLFNGGAVKNFYRVIDAAPVAPTTNGKAVVSRQSTSQPPSFPQAEHGEPPPEEQSVFDDPSAGAFADRRAGLIAEISTIAAKAYGKQQHHKELLKMGEEVAAKSIQGLMELTYMELEKVKAIVSLDATGLAVYGEKWYGKLSKAVEGRGKASIYEFAAGGVDAIHKAVWTAIEASKAAQSAK